ncbi:hydrogenase nickel incorporation protein HypB [Desulfofundulus thermosubterraneus]|uniref:Hydrogenase nickel incorporation protein HypB n=1 Tax=Desulfofundulus thermosubterraneus DSM 16057 TaxID=1121432 RepID=A0A1M6FBJ1_9FIRM|nr:hydrogenase nickel incorporation protein HypB [Desulfofundulus thermosubterraneus]SHI95021.1 hydrogenase nickel incorporation protein HypB [Desulfofundulus thermosubterraneus DSM 16057]
MKVVMARKLLSANQQVADKNRTRLGRVLTVNLISSPGAGKTAILERTIAVLKDEFRTGVIEGDIYTTRDAERIAVHGVEVVQINTTGVCHLDASMIAQALDEINTEALDIMFIENVGNLVCPAEFDLGEDYKVAVLSVAEGGDKPTKYPLVFQEAQVVLINKSDLLPYSDFDLEMVRQEILAINSKTKVFVVSAKTGEGLEAWYAWLRDAVKEKKGSSATG